MTTSPRSLRIAITIVTELFLAIAAVGAVPPANPATRPAAPATAPAVRSADAYLIHLPGIAGHTQIDNRMVAGIQAGGFAGKTEIYDWTGEQEGIAALQNRARHTDEAQRIADKIVAFRKEHPKGQILLSGHSGGTGIAIFALEKLPKDVMVDGVLLLSPALSRKYDLSPALAHVRGKAYAFTSTMDVFVLNAGTRVFGTIDGKKEESAGVNGFVRPEKPADPSQYDKLVECPYDRTWTRFGNIGDHVSVMSTAFAEHVLTPIVMSHLPGGGGPLTRPFAPLVNLLGPATKPTK